MCTVSGSHITFNNNITLVLYSNMPPQSQKVSVILRNKLLPILAIMFINEDFNAQKIHNLSKFSRNTGAPTACKNFMVLKVNMIKTELLISPLST